MRNRIGRLIAAAFALNLLASLAMAQSELGYKELPNFHKVNEGLYRGAQPREGGIQKLAALGIKTILNLRAADAHALAEEREALAAGLRYFNVAMEGLDRPKDELIGRALAIINDPANQPVFVHCKHGADRTGTVIAIYRITHDGWSGEQALHEAKQYGLSWMQFGMKDFIKDYARDHGKERTGRNRPSAREAETTRAVARSHDERVMGLTLDLTSGLTSDLSSGATSEELLLRRLHAS